MPKPTVPKAKAKPQAAAAKKAVQKKIAPVKSQKAKGKQPAPAVVTAKKSAGALENAARIALVDCMAVLPGETVMILTDENKRNIGVTMWQVAKELHAEAILVEMTPRVRNGEEPPTPVAAMMAMSSVVLCPTTKSVTHTAARREAVARGARIATLPGITEDMMIRCLNADYRAIARRSIRLSEELQKAKEIHVTSPAGTDIVMQRGDRYPKPNTGLYHNPGDSGNLPAGETFFAPVEGTAQGTVVFEAAVAGIGKIKKPIHLVVRDGLAVEISGGAEAQQLNTLVEAVGTFGRNIAELGIGTNDKAQITGVILEDEKVMGTVHIALGDNKSMGGNVAVSSHLDGLILEPTVRIDGRVLMQAGKLLIA
jgi:leucyl aminopeptidase (aminopeptidase T)